MTQESEITLRNERTEFRVFLYREGNEEPVGTLEGVVEPEFGRLVKLSFTDAVSARTTYMPNLLGR
jgi:hypothetical protein